MEESSNLQLHPIQATFVGVRELYIKAHRPPTNYDELPKTLEPHIKMGHSKYQEDEKCIQVFVTVEIGKELNQDQVEADDVEESPFHLRVELGAEFEVNEDLFPKEKVGEWASMNAPFILFPYIREQVYSLTARCGFPPLLLPLLEVPTIRIQRNEK